MSANTKRQEISVRTATVYIEYGEHGPVVVLPVAAPEDELGRPSAVLRKARDLADALRKVEHWLKYDHTAVNLDTARIASSVRGAAARKRLSTRDLAHAAGVSIQKMRDLKAGRKPYQMDELTGIATAMGKGIVEFMDDVEKDAVWWRNAELHDPDQPAAAWRQALTEVLA